MGCSPRSEHSRMGWGPKANHHWLIAMILGRGVALDNGLTNFTKPKDEASIQIMSATDVRMRESVKIVYQGLLSFVEKGSDGWLARFQG